MLIRSWQTGERLHPLLCFTCAYICRACNVNGDLQWIYAIQSPVAAIVIMPAQANIQRSVWQQVISRVMSFLCSTVPLCLVFACVHARWLVIWGLVCSRSSSSGSGRVGLPRFSCVVVSNINTIPILILGWYSMFDTKMLAGAAVDSCELGLAYVYINIYSRSYCSCYKHIPTYIVGRCMSGEGALCPGYIVLQYYKQNGAAPHRAAHLCFRKLYLCRINNPGTRSNTFTPLRPFHFNPYFHTR